MLNLTTYLLSFLPLLHALERRRIHVESYLEENTNTHSIQSTIGADKPTMIIESSIYDECLLAKDISNCSTYIGN